jgi:thioredoxin reductase (NADPH)
METAVADSKNPVKDVTIIGAGPVGLFAVFQCGMLGLTTQVIDSLPDIGGQCTALYPEKPIYDIPAYPEVSAADLIENLSKQAAPFKPDYYMNQQVVSIRNNDGIWDIKTSAIRNVQSKTIIIAGGAGSFGPNRPPLENIEEYEGLSVFYMVQRKKDFADKDVVIAGGGDSAVDWALSLADIAKSVCLVHRRDKFRAAPESVNKLRELSAAGKIKILTPYQLHGLEGQNGTLEKLHIKQSDGTVRSLEADILLPFYGLSMDLGPISEWGLTIDNHHIVTNPTTAQTNIEKIYAIGDIAAYEHKKKLILTGFSEAAFAAHHIYDFLNPDTPLHFEYSTTKGVPKG